MIKLAAMLLFVVVGAVIGILFFRLSSRLSGQYRSAQPLTLPLCIGLGILGAFGGLLIADLTDIRLVGNLIDGLLFSSIGSTLLLGINLVFRTKN